MPFDTWSKKTGKKKKIILFNVYWKVEHSKKLEFDFAVNQPK